MSTYRQYQQLTRFDYVDTIYPPRQDRLSHIAKVMAYFCRFAPENKTDQQQYTWLPFGIGGRNCIGMRLALLEIKLGVFKMMRAFKLEMAANTPTPVRLKVDFHSSCCKDPLDIWLGRLQYREGNSHSVTKILVKQ